MYATSSELAKLIQDARTTGTVSDRLIGIMSRIADGVHSSRRYKIDRDDYRQDCLIALLKVVSKVDTTGNVFAYLSTVCNNVARQEARRIRIQDRLLTGFYEYRVLVGR